MTVEAKMFSFISIALLLVHVTLIHFVLGQDSPKCMPVGLCFPRVVEVDPRIVTTDEDRDGTPENNIQACDAGYELCYPYEGNFECGVRYSANFSDANGPTSRGSHPWQVYMMRETDKQSIYIGSGVLISETIVLTAAHKVHTSIDTPKKIKIYTGVNNPTGIAIPPAIFSEAVLIVVHEDFKFEEGTLRPIDFKDDIALVLLDTPQPLKYRTDLGIGCFPRATDSFADKERYPTCMVGGWGETAFQVKDDGKVHKQVTVPVVTMEECKKSMLRRDVLGPEATAKYLDEKKELCAGGEQGKDACTQDGGAPLMCYDTMSKRFVIAGLVIWGKGCAKPGVYGAYVDVTKYVDWITEKMGELKELL